LKRSSAAALTIGGPNLTAHAIKAGLVDECHLFIAPVSLGAGKAALPRDMRLDLELLDERRFDSGAVYVRYRVAT
jgi:dihydrofolate reductase